MTKTETETEKDLQKVIINLIRNRKVEHDVTVTFTIKTENKDNFHAILTNYLNEIPKTFKITVKTADDTATHKPVKCFIDIESFGLQQVAIQRLQQYVDILRPYCSDIK